MGVFKRYKNAQAAQKDAENAMPGAYQSNYTDRINEALDSMGAASNAGYDVGTDSELYRQYRAGAQANARAAAENAAAGAAALSGGYGSSYANSVAQQGYQQAMANVDSGLAGLRDKALTMYQLKQNGLSGLLSALQNQDSLEAAEHQGAVANAQDWRDYKKSRADKAGALTTAAGLAGGGSDEAARAVLELYGLDPNSVGNYRTIAGRQLATALAKKSAGSSGGSSGSRSSGGTEGSGDSWTNSQLQSIAKTFSSMKGNEPLYDFYKRTLTDAGWIKDDTPNLLETDRGLTGQSWKGDPANKWGTGTSNRQSQSTGRTASQSSVPQRAQVAANAIKGQRNHGSDDQTIFDSLKYQGYTDDEIWKAFELAG